MHVMILILFNSKYNKVRDVRTIKILLLSKNHQ